MSSVVGQLKDELTELANRLHVMKLASSSSLFSAMAIFELLLTQFDVIRTYRDVLAGDSEIARIPDPDVFRYQYEDSLSDTIRLVLRGGSMPSSISTGINRESLEAACEAWEFELARQAVLRQLEASTVNLVETEVDKSTIKFKTAEDARALWEYELALSLRDARIQHDLRFWGVDELKRPPANMWEVWRTMMLQRMEREGFTGCERVADCSTLEYAQFWLALTEMCYMRIKENRRKIHDFNIKGRRLNSDDIRRFVLSLPRKKVIERISTKGGLSQSKTQRIISMLTFRGPPRTDEIFVRPILKASNLIVIMPHVIVNNNVFRNLRRNLALDQPSEYSVLAEMLGKNFEKKVKRLLSEAAYVVRSPKLRDSGRRVVTDVDVLAYKSRNLLIIQLKNLACSDSGRWTEIVRTMRETRKGIDQLTVSASLISTHLSEVMKDLFGIDSCIGIKIIPLLVTNTKIEETYGRTNVGIIDFFGFKQVIDKESVEDFLDSSKILPEAREAREFPAVRLEGTIGRFSISMEAHTDSFYKLPKDGTLSFGKAFDVKRFLDVVDVLPSR